MRQSAGRRRWTVAVTVPTGSLTVTRAMPDAGFGRDPGAGCDRGERDHLHGIVAESHALEGDAVHRAVVFADPAVGTAVVVDQDLAGLPAELLTKHRVADLDESATRCVATLAIDHDVERLLRANVVARPAENARRLVDVVDGVALETAQCGGDRLLIVPGQLDRGHIHALLGRKDGPLLPQVVVGIATGSAWRCPQAMASTMKDGPCTQSPPAKSLATLVCPPVSASSSLRGVSGTP